MTSYLLLNRATEAGDVLAAEDVLLKQPHPIDAAVDHHVPSVEGVHLRLVGHDVVFVN